MRDNQLVKGKESRKAVGAAENNRNELRELIGEAKRFAGGLCVFKDRAGNVIYVDTVEGKIAQLERVINPDTGEAGISYRWYTVGEESSKDNGYVYTPVIIDGLKGKQETFICATHTVVAMLAHTNEYDAIDEQGKTPICNHKDNCPWNNKAENLEWGLQGGNTRHGKIVSSINEYYGDTYTSIMNNLGKTDFVVLDQSISMRDIERYTDCVDNKAIFKCEDTGYISEDVIDGFIDWLKDTGIWN